MKKRGVSPEQIDEAVRAGPSIDAINKATGGPAVRYVNPTTGQSAVIDSTTGQVVHVGKPSFKYGPLGGDVLGQHLGQHRCLLKLQSLKSRLSYRTLSDRLEDHQ